VQGINFSGSRIGAAFALPLVAIIISNVGWRMSFVIFGGIGVVFAFLWYFLFRNRPEESGVISDKEKEARAMTVRVPAKEKEISQDLYC